MGIDDQIRKHVFDRQQKRWAGIAAEPGVIGRLFQSVFGKSPTEGIFIVEHAAADPDSFLCAGAAISAWRLDRNGLREVAPSDVDAGRTVGKLSQFQIARMFISDDDQHVFLNEMEGPKQSTLMHLQPKLKDGCVEKLKVVRARLVLGGHAVG